MRTLAFALIALAVLTGAVEGAVEPVSAFDGKSYFEQLGRNLP